MWYAKSIEEVLKELNVDPVSGLSDAEAKVRLAKFGANKLIGKKKRSIFQLFISQLKDWLIYVLFAAVIITLFLGEFADAIIIVMVIIINAVHVIHDSFITRIKVMSIICKLQSKCWIV